MSNNIFNQVGGIITVCLKGKHLEKIINLAMSRGIYIWDIKKDQDWELTFKIRSSALQALQTIAEENNYELNVVRKQGFPFFKGRIKRRIGFLGGAFLFTFALYIMSSFIWFIQVTGNDKITTEQILLACNKNGVFPGAFKKSFTRNEVEEEILRQIPELSYIEINIRGVKADIKVVEKILPQGGITGPCHIVAAKDGVVEDILVLEGQAVTKIGAAVNKGDILISGIVIPQKNDEFISNLETDNQYYLPTAVRARGTVKARVSYGGYGECELYSENRTLTGTQSSQVAFETSRKRYVLLGEKNNPYENAIEETNKKILHTPWGEWAVVKTVYKEQNIQEIKYSEKDALAIATERARENLASEANGELPENVKISILSRPSDNIVRVKALLETVEDIALAQPLQE